MAGLVVAWTPNMPCLPVHLRKDQNSELWSPADAPHYTRTHQETSDPIRLQNLRINRCQNPKPPFDSGASDRRPQFLLVSSSLSLKWLWLTLAHSYIYWMSLSFNTFSASLSLVCSRLLSLFSLSRLLSLFLSVSFALSFSLTLCVASMASMAYEHCFFCKAEIAEFITGWPLKDGSFAKLCGKCG